MMKDYKTPTLVVHALKIKTLMAGSYGKDVFSGSVDTNTSDIAVFKLEGVAPSPLSLAEDSPRNGDVLTSVSYLHYGKKNPNATSAFDATNEVYEKLVCNAKVTELYNNFFVCYMEVELKPGSSGSPVIDEEGRVVGILHGGKDNLCVFQSSESLVQLMKKD